MRELAVGEGHGVVPAEDDAAAGFGRQFQCVVRQIEVDVMRVDDVWLDTLE